MKIKTKFAVNDMVYAMFNGKVYNGIIDQIIVEGWIGDYTVKYKLGGYLWDITDKNVFSEDEVFEEKEHA